MLITDTCVPDRFIEWDKWGCQTMARLEDGWCAALDRNTMKCTICALGLNRRQIGKKWLLARMPSLSSPAP